MGFVRMFAVRFHATAAVLAAVAAAHGLAYLPLVSTSEKTDSWSYIAGANALQDGTYTTPLKAGFYFVYPHGWFDITGARIDERAWGAPERQVFRPPGYPAYLALFGETDVFGGDHTGALVGQAALFGLGAFLLMLTVRRWWGENVALLAGLFYAVDPWSKHYVPLVLSETLAGTIAMAALYAFTRAWERPRSAWWPAAGALTAGLALTRAVFVVAPLLALVAAAARVGSVRERALRVAATAAAAAVLLVPWLAWTHSVVGRATMSVWGQGYNLFVAASGEGHGRSHGDVEADREFQRRMDRIRASAPATEELLRDPTAHPRYLALADEAVREQAYRLYRERLESHPADVVWDALYRMWFLWAAHKDWYQPAGIALLPLRALDWVVLLLALVGAAVAVRGRGAPRGVVLFLGAYTAVLGVHHVEARFAMPLRGVLLALVALTLGTLWQRRREREDGEPERNRRGAPD